MNRNSSDIWGLIPWLVLWEVISRFIVNDVQLFPSLFSIFTNTFDLLFVTQTMLPHLTASGFRFFTAILIAVPIGFGLALLSASLKPVHIVLNPLIKVSFPIPKVALIPFLLLAFGTGDSSKIALISLGLFYLVYANTFHGAQQLLQGPLSDLIQIYRIRGSNYWVKILARGSVPDFLVGLKTGLNYGLTLVVISEISMTNFGVGAFIWSAWDSFRIIDMYSGLVIIGLCGFFINSLSESLIRRFSEFR